MLRNVLFLPQKTSGFAIVNKGFSLKKAIRASYSLLNIIHDTKLLGEKNFFGKECRLVSSKFAPFFLLYHCMSCKATRFVKFLPVKTSMDYFPVYKIFLKHSPLYSNKH